jgi:hypothetical protein
LRAGVTRDADEKTALTDLDALDRINDARIGIGAQRPQTGRGDGMRVFGFRLRRSNRAAFESIQVRTLRWSIMVWPVFWDMVACLAKGKP